jgi:hypothetical protein
VNIAWTGYSRYRPAPTVRRMRLGYRSVFFCERAQRLFELNRTADIIWSALLEGATPQVAKRALVRLGAQPDEAEAFVDRQLNLWLRDGYWTPAEAMRPGLGGGTHALRLAVETLEVEILCAHAEAAARLKTVFGHFPSFSGTPAVQVAIVAWTGGFHIFTGETYCGSVAPQELAPRIRALLTELLIHLPGDGFYAHGALLSRGGRTVLLFGQSGAGKSTLGAALTARGYTSLADDIIRVDGLGLFGGIPFAPVLKEDAWPLLAPYFPGLENWPVEQRMDRQRIRYAPVASPSQKPKAPDLVLVLARQDGCLAFADILDPVEALSAVLSDAFAAQGRLKAGLMARLAERLREADCRRLFYSDLDDAYLEIERLRQEL